MHPFRIVEEFLDGFLRVEALMAAFQLGVIDALDVTPLYERDLIETIHVDAKHFALLAGLLVQQNVLRRQGDVLAISDRFRQALEYRDLLEARMDWAHRVRGAMIEFFALSIRDPEKHQHHLVNFYKFDTRPDYPESVAEMTRGWVRHMSTYTKYSAPSLLARNDFSSYRRILDIGGNNGELASQICRAHPGVQITILDIPPVCDLGVENIRSKGLSDRITFVPGDARITPFPEGFDAVIFSSMLHDHDSPAISLFLSKAYKALAPGGDLILWETYAIDFARERFAEHHVELIPFMSYYGPPQRYESELRRLGFDAIRTEQVDEIRFLLTRAQRPRTVA